MTNAPVSPSWSFLDDWRAPVLVPTWAPVQPWLALVQELASRDRQKAADLRAAWDKDLEDLGGDPSGVDWSSFRPLRREREEDWSDWLAQLIGDSEHGVLAKQLFGEGDRGRPAIVHRERAVEDRRADLVIEWRDGSYAHLEVKIGDPHLDKTLETSTKVRASMGGRPGADYVLILPSQQSAWTRLCETVPACGAIQLITWRTVSQALRRALTSPSRESTRWRVWAHALCGAVESELLGLRAGPDAWQSGLPVTSLILALDLLNRDNV